MTDRNKLLELSISCSNVNSNDENMFRISDTPESLLSNCDNMYPLTEEDLLYYLKDYDKVISFLYYTSLLPPDKRFFSFNELIKLSNLDLLMFFGYIIYYLLSRISFLFDFGIVLYELYSNLFMYFKDSEKSVFNLKFWDVTFLFLSLILQQIVSIIAIYVLNNKLTNKTSKIDIPIYFQVLSTCKIFVIVSSLSCAGFLYIIFSVFYNLSKNSFYNNFLSIIADYNVFMTIFIQGSILLFVLVDTHVSVSIVEDLLRAAKGKTLTMDKIYWARNEIERRVKSSLFINTSISIVSLMNIVSFGLFVYTDQLNISAFTTVNSGLYFLKESFFIAIVFHEISKVNEIANDLTKYVTSSKWESEATRTDLHQSNIAINLYSNPISFTILGQRLTKRDLLIQVSVTAITYIVGLLNNKI